MRIKPTLLAAAAISLLSTGTYAVDWGGYVRVGPGQKQATGDGKRCFDGRGNDPVTGASLDGGSGAPGKGGIVGSSRVDLQACKLEYSIVSPK